MRRILSAVAAAGLVTAPASATAMERLPTPIGENERISGSPMIVILLVALLAAGLIVAVSDSEDPVSP